MPRIKVADRTMIRVAASRLRAGEVIAFPTETVYGLGGDSFNPFAIDRIFDLKGRPESNPLIVHVIDQEQARRDVASAWDERCATLAERFWPGPLTLVVQKIERVPTEVTAGLSTVAIRAPAHTVTRDLLRDFGGPIAAPSANRSGGVSPTSARHVADDFADVDDLLILDGGPCEFGIESTVIDMTHLPPVILRPGSVTIESIREVVGEIQSHEIRTQSASPGTSPRHYAPRTPLRLADRAEIERVLCEGDESVVVLAIRRGDQSQSLRPNQHVIPMPNDAVNYAKMLYSALRDADARGASFILVERPPSDAGLWRSIRDRLERAASLQ